MFSTVPALSHAFMISFIRSLARLLARFFFHSVRLIFDIQLLNVKPSTERVKPLTVSGTFYVKILMFQHDGRLLPFMDYFVLILEIGHFRDC